MYYFNKWVNATLLESEDPEDSDEEDHESKPAVHFGDLQWHVILGICLVSIGLFIVIVCVAWSCLRRHCCPSAPKQIGKLKVIVRQPSIESLGDGISNQRTWVTATSITNLEESHHPSIFQVLPSLQNPKDVRQPNDNNPPSYETAQSEKRKKLERFLSV